MPLTGILLLNKPAGVTSHDVVARVKRELREREGERVKVGHAGTLDPFATGLLLILVGRATRAQQFLMGLRKSYRVVARLGWTSDTGDRDGELVQTGRIPVDPHIPTGPQMQRPPAFSAVKVDGERLYQRARRGDPVEGEPRPITIYSAMRLRLEGDMAEFAVDCSAGTYVRQLVSALGEAYCEELERTAIGPFLLQDADPDRIVPLEEALGFMAARALDAAEAEGLRHGRPVPAHGEDPEAPVRLMDGEHLLAVGRLEDGLVKPVVVFHP